MSNLISIVHTWYLVSEVSSAIKLQVTQNNAIRIPLSPTDIFLLRYWSPHVKIHIYQKRLQQPVRQIDKRMSAVWYKL